MPKNTLYLTEQAWLKYGKRGDDIFPVYQRRLSKLRKLCGIYPIGLGLPSWWQELVQEIRNKGWRWSIIADLFQSITIKEFRNGQFQIKRHKKYRQRIQGPESRFISSPKIGKFLKEQFGVRHPFTIAFHNRGAKALKKEVVITDDPWDIVNMSSRGKSWTSCQNFLENNYCEVWSNLCDKGMILAFTRTQGDESEKNMDTRAIIRYALVRGKGGKSPMKGVMIDRFYGDAAYVSEIQKLILKLCEKHKLCLFECRKYDSHQDSIASYRMIADEKDEFFTVSGPSIKFSNDSHSYTDNFSWTEEKRKNCYHMEAEAHLIFAPAPKEKNERNSAI